MRTHIASAVALLLFASMAIGAKEATPIVVNVRWDISLDADGHVTKLATKDEYVPTLHAQLEERIRAWLFSPGKVNGKPAATDSHLWTLLEFKPVAAGYEMRLLSASTGVGYNEGISPRYPDSLVRERKQGEVVLRVHYDGAGAITDVAPYEHGPKADARFMQAAITAVKRWTFATEVVGGHGIAGWALIPVCFQLSGRSPPCDWKNPTTGESLGAGQAVALDPAAKLESDVIGHTL